MEFEGGERLVDVGRGMDYRDGSGVLQVVTRLEKRASHDKEMGRRMVLMRRDMSSVDGLLLKPEKPKNQRMSF